MTAVRTGLGLVLLRLQVTWERRPRLVLGLAYIAGAITALGVLGILAWARIS